MALITLDDLPRAAKDDKASNTDVVKDGVVFAIAVLEVNSHLGQLEPDVRDVMQEDDEDANLVVPARPSTMSCRKMMRMPTL